MRLRTCCRERGAGHAVGANQREERGGEGGLLDEPLRRGFIETYSDAGELRERYVQSCGAREERRDEDRSDTDGCYDSVHASGRVYAWCRMQPASPGLPRSCWVNRWLHRSRFCPYPPGPRRSRAARNGEARRFIGLGTASRPASRAPFSRRRRRRGVSSPVRKGGRAP
jgi:hypothetical protein